MLEGLEALRSPTDCLGPRSSQRTERHLAQHLDLEGKFGAKDRCAQHHHLCAEMGNGGNCLQTLPAAPRHSAEGRSQ